MVAGLATDGGEESAGVDGRARDGESVDAAVRVGIPGRDGAAGVQGGQVIAGHGANGDELPADVDGRARDGEGVDLAARIGVPAGSQAAGRIQGGDVVAALTTDEGKDTADVDGRARDGEGVDRAVDSGIGIPGRREAAGGIQGGDVVAGLAANGVEESANVDGRARDEEGLDDEARVGIPGRSEAARSIEGGDVVAGLAADLVEVTTNVDGRSRDGESVNPAAKVGVRVPGRGEAADRIQGSDAAAGLPADRVEVPAHVDGRARDGESVDRGKRGVAGEAWVGIPGRGRPGYRVQGGDAVAELAADGSEGPADVERRAREGESCDGAVGVVLVEGNIHLSVGQDVGDLVAIDSAHLAEGARDVEATGAVSNRCRHRAVHPRKPAIDRVAGRRKGDTASHVEPDVGEIPTDVGDPVGRGGDGPDTAVRERHPSIRRGAG